jgi:hypothetical protein
MKMGIHNYYRTALLFQLASLLMGIDSAFLGKTSFIQDKELLDTFCGAADATAPR